MIGPWKWAVIRSDLATREKAVALCLAVRMNDDGTIPNQYRPSIAQLSRDCGLTPRTVSAALALLEDAGYLAVTRGSGKTRSRYVAIQPHPDSALQEGSTAVKQHPSTRSGASDDSAEVLSNSTTEVLSNDTQPPQVPPRDTSIGRTSTSQRIESLHPLAIIERLVEDGMKHIGYVLQSARMLLRDERGLTAAEEYENRVIDTNGNLDQLSQLSEDLVDQLLTQLLIGQDDDRYHPLDEIENLIRVGLLTEADLLAQARALAEKIAADGWDLAVETTSLDQLHELWPWWALDQLLDHVAPTVAA